MAKIRKHQLVYYIYSTGSSWEVGGPVKITRIEQIFDGSIWYYLDGVSGSFPENWIFAFRSDAQMEMASKYINRTYQYRYYRYAQDAIYDLGGFYQL